MSPNALKPAGLAMAAMLSACSPHFANLRKVPDALAEIRQNMTHTRDSAKHVLRMPKGALRVYTKNVNGLPEFIGGETETKHLAAIKEILETDPDYFMIEEAMLKGDVRDLWRPMLPNYYITTGPDHANPLFNIGGLIIGSKEKPAKSEFILFKNQGKILSEQFSDRLLQKGILIAKFPQKKLAVIATHLLSTYDEDASNDEGNKEQAMQLRDEIKKLENSGYNVIIGGDMNFEPGSPQDKILNTVSKNHSLHVGPTHNSKKSFDEIRSSFDDGEAMGIGELPDENMPADSGISDHRAVLSSIFASAEQNPKSDR